MNYSVADVSESKSFFTDSENPAKKRINKRNYINYPLFLESLAITAMTFKFNDKFSEIDKVIKIAKINKLNIVDALFNRKNESIERR